MRIKTDYMGNDQLLPAYNVQIAVADEYITVARIFQYRNDMDCFVPLMEEFNERYSFYPKYPVADAGYGSYNNYIYCQDHGMEKYMKFTMYKKTVTDDNYRNDPFRPVNYKIDEEGCHARMVKRWFSLIEKMFLAIFTEDRKKYMFAKIVRIVLILINVRKLTKIRQFI